MQQWYGILWLLFDFVQKHSIMKNKRIVPTYDFVLEARAPRRKHLCHLRRKYLALLLNIFTRFGLPRLLILQLPGSWDKLGEFSNRSWAILWCYAGRQTTERWMWLMKTIVSVCPEQANSIHDSPNPFVLRPTPLSCHSTTTRAHGHEFLLFVEHTFRA